MAKISPFRIFYTSFYTFLVIVLIGLHIITPADCIQQALHNKQLYNVFVVAGCYVFTILVCLLIYAARLYTTRTVLAAIPKTYVPVEKDDVTKKVRAMIVAALTRSAAISWDIRPHADPEVPTAVSASAAKEAFARPASDEEERARHMGHQSADDDALENQVILLPPHEPSWAAISHHGWASSTCADLPNVEYSTVVAELPHLIEARAVSLAPRDATSEVDPPLPDLRAVDILQRPVHMGLRDYLAHLTSFGVLPMASSPIMDAFLQAYEFARFSARPLSEAQFRDLMAQFAEMLSLMQPLDLGVLLDYELESDSSYLAAGHSSFTTASMTSQSGTASLRSVITRPVSGSASEGTVHTAPSHPLNDSRLLAVSTTPVYSQSRVYTGSSSTSSFASSVIRQLAPDHMGDSNRSLASVSSSSQGSVVRRSLSRGSDWDEASL